MALGTVACQGTTDPSTDQPGADAAAESSTPDALAQEAGDGGVVVFPVAADFSGKCEEKDDDSDYQWDAATEVAITLGDEAIVSTSDKAAIDGTTVTIAAAGTYRLSGTVADGRIVVNAADKGVVRLILDNAHITSATGSAVEVQNASRAIIILADGTTNSLADAATRADADSASAALFSKEDLALGGKGALAVVGSYADAIASSDTLVIRDGTLSVQAVDDGIRGKDCLAVAGGTLTIHAGGDGLKSSNDEDPALGYVFVRGGKLAITAAGDGIAATTSVYVTQGDLELTTGGGSSKTVGVDASAKGIKGTAGVVVDDGTLHIDSADDGVHSGGVVYLNGGSWEIASGDDGVHADGDVTLNAPTLDITRSYEGIEGQVITINGGDIHIVSSDDGLNASDGTGASMNGDPMGDGGGPGTPDAGAPGMDGGAPPDMEGGMPPGMDGGPPGAPDGGPPGMPDGGPPEMPDGGGQPGMPDGGSNASNLLVAIHGGRIVIDSYGDGIDSNGNMLMTGGTVLVSGPFNDGNGTIDIGNGPGFSLNINGGFLIAAGSAGMAIAPSDTSTQHSVFVTTGAGGGGTPGGGGGGSGAMFPAGTLVHIQNALGEDLLTFAPAKQYASIIFSSPKLVNGSYTLFTGGTCSGTPTDCLYEGGTYESGTQKATFTVGDSSTVTSVTWTP